ncbi:hypothetical protein BV22DRAFT_1130778 [Leucogyrophana mollusca]|uniref:Uncharacterized protein n=1 Tax=Leucogyrophana mollusca TaxID=85980 RepID=A0ACB8BEL5_9AGAM|nr:hypothetical protein BV22DRAFT_1130778 [Leucogyrophana mollusca]
MHPKRSHPSANLLSTLLRHAALLMPETISYLQHVCLVTSTQALFASAARGSLFHMMGKGATATDALLAHTHTTDTIRVRDVGTGGGVLRLRAETWHVVLALLDHRPPTYFGTRLVIEAPPLLPKIRGTHLQEPAQHRSGPSQTNTIPSQSTPSNASLATLSVCAIIVPLSSEKHRLAYKAGKGRGNDVGAYREWIVPAIVDFERSDDNGMDEYAWKPKHDLPKFDDDDRSSIRDPQPQHFSRRAPPPHAFQEAQNSYAEYAHRATGQRGAPSPGTRGSRFCG